MRTKDLKIDGKIRQAVLLAGGSGFKIYSASDFNGWVVAKGRKIFPVSEQSPEFRTVSQYVNLRYQPLSEQERIKTNFNNLVASLTDPTSKETDNTI